jgi:hypothetical protein
LVKEFNDSGTELDEVLKYNFGKRLFVDFAGHGLPFRAVVDQLLEGTERQGSTVKLCMGVLKFRSMNPSIREIIGTIVPDARAGRPEVSADVADALAGVQAVRDRLGSSAVRDRLAISSNNLKQVVRELDLLERYKTLHDSLHILQIKHFRLIADSVKHLDNSSSRETLDEYLQQLRFQATNSRNAAQGLPDTPGERDVEMSWVGTLENVINGFTSAIDTRDRSAAIGAMYQLKAILRGQPGRLDNLLVITARRAQVYRLIETLETVANALNGGAEGSVALTKGILALQRLVPDQMGLVAEHTAWQQVVSDLWQADEALYQSSAESLEEFQYLWQSICSKVRSISASNPQAQWAIALSQNSAAFDKGFPMPASPPVPPSVRDLFGRFHRDITFQFYKVDKALHTQCSEIIKLGGPLQRLLQDVSNGNN